MQEKDEKYSCLIVDDDAFATLIMKQLVEHDEELHLLTTISNGQEALRYVKQVQVPDIIFLDIEMPVMNGLDFMRQAYKDGAQLIVCSSKAQYALDSFEFEVCDYLLKPVDKQRFERALNKAKAAITQRNVFRSLLEKSKTEQLANVGGDDRVLWIKDIQRKDVKLMLSEVVYAEAVENYVAIQMVNMRYMVHSTFKAFCEELLKNEGFMKIHRSFVVNVNYAKAYKSPGVLVVEYGGDEFELPVGRGQVDELKKMLKDTGGNPL